MRSPTVLRLLILACVMAVSGLAISCGDNASSGLCETDEDCPFEDGFCKHNEVGGRGFCSARCDRYCDDRWGYPVSFCVDNPDDDDQGMCVLKEQDQNLGCRTGDHMVPETRSRFGEAWRTATVCVPGSPGWIGDRCQGDDDCGQGLSCLTDDAGELGVCTQACDRYCPDQPGWPWTYCASDNPTGGNTCVRECTPDSNGSECAAGFTCEPLEAAAYSSTKYACVPEFF